MCDARQEHLDFLRAFLGVEQIERGSVIQDRSHFVKPGVRFLLIPEGIFGEGGHSSKSIALIRSQFDAS